MPNWVEREAKRTNRNVLIFNTVLLAAVVTLFVVNRDADYRSNFILVGAGAILLLIAGWNCFRVMRRMGEIQTTPVWKQMSIYGEVEQLAHQVDQDLQMDKARYKTITLTRSWLIRKGTFTAWISPIGDLAWVYKKVTRHYTNFIPTGKTYAVIFVGRHRQRIEVPLSQKQTDNLLGELATRVPWAIFGYSKEIQDAWAKDPGGFVAAVDSRHQQFLSKSGAANR